MGWPPHAKGLLEMDEPKSFNETTVGKCFGFSALSTLPKCLNGGRTASSILDHTEALSTSQVLAGMEKQQRSNRRRVYSVEPNALVCANFSQKYISYLLPALLNVTSIGSSGRNKDNKVKKTIRFQVDMALVLSTGEFRWSRALRRKLEQGMDPRKLHNTATFEATTISTFDVEMLGQFLVCPGIPKPVDNVETQMNLKPTPKLNETSRLRTIDRRQGAQRKEIRREEETDDHIKILRMLLPGGNEMGLNELLSEVESYVVCLQLQVNILRSLVGPH